MKQDEKASLVMALNQALGALRDTQPTAKRTIKDGHGQLYARAMDDLEAVKRHVQDADVSDG